MMHKKPQTVPTVYEVRIRGSLDEQWSDWFGGLQIEPQPHGETLLTGQLADQAALHGLLDRVFDLGLVLLSVRCIESTLWDGQIPGERD